MFTPMKILYTDEQMSILWTNNSGPEPESEARARLYNCWLLSRPGPGRGALVMRVRGRGGGDRGILIISSFY